MAEHNGNSEHMSLFSAEHPALVRGCLTIAVLPALAHCSLSDDEIAASLTSKP
jgi:hypothetical protein